MRLLAIDPGPTESAWVAMRDDHVFGFNKYENASILELIDEIGSDHLAIEMVACYGMPVGAEVFETVLWSGRFVERFGGPYTKVYRNEVKLNLCHSPRANDSTIRQAIIDRFGGKERAIGRKATPGPLHGVSGDVWQALAVGLTWIDMHSRDARRA